MSIRFSILIAVAALASSCNTARNVFDIGKQTPRDAYIAGLEKGKLIGKRMVKEWIDAGSPQLHDSVVVTLPFQEAGYFPAAEPQARFYRFNAQAGQILTLNALIKSKEPSSIFVDLFVRKDTTWKHVEHADSTMKITYEFEEGGSYLARLQPELLVDVYYSISLAVTPVLINPVKGASNKSIGSFYGDSRDGGKRKHEGVDIFAKKGTLIIAPTDGVINRVGYSNLGGKVVWMNDLKRRHSYYFAHLDSQIVTSGMKVRQGDAIGTVGNTGNAKNTPSHLHFGIYQRNSKDPVAYIRTMEKLVNEMMPDTLFESVVFRAAKNKTALRSGPSIKSEVSRTVSKDTWMKVIAQSGEWYRTITASHEEGFVLKTALTPATNGKTLRLMDRKILLTAADITAVPKRELKNSVEVLANAGDFFYVKDEDGVTGWMEK